MKTIILGLGNSLLGDDAIGLILVEKLSEQIKHPDLDFKTSEKVGLNLIELVQDYDRAIIIDSIITGNHPPGTVLEFSLDDLPDNPRLRCPHDADFKSAIILARKTGLKMPEEIIILGIEVIDNLTFTQDLSPELSALFPLLFQNLCSKIHNHLFCKSLS